MSEVAQAPQLRFPEFIGEWDVTNFGNISSIKRGASPRPISSPKWFDKDSSVGWVRISDVTKSKKYLKKTEQYLSEDGINRSRKVDKGNLIMSICATIGKPIYTNFNVCIHDGFIVFDSLSEDKGFIYYLLEKIQKKWYRYGQPGTQVNLNSDIVSSEIFSIPTKPEQQKIAAFLAAVDSKIEQLSKKQALLGEYKKGLMEQIFSQAIRFKANDGSDFPDWEEKKLGDLSVVISDGNYGELYPTSSDFKLTGVPFLRANNIKSLKIDGTDTKYITEEQHSLLTSGHLQTNDILITTRGVLGNLAIVESTHNGSNINAQICLLRVTNTSELNHFYLLFVLDHRDSKKQYKAFETGTALKQLPKGNLRKIKLKLPTLFEQNKIANFLSSIDTKIEQVDKQLDESKQFKKALLQQMFV